MFGYDFVTPVTVAISDPQADGTLVVFKVPSRWDKAELLSAWAVTDTTITKGSGTGIALRILDYGSTGTAVSGTMSASLGGTAVTWTTDVPKDFTISEGTIDGGDYVVITYDETGTVGLCERSRRIAAPGA